MTMNLGLTGELDDSPEWHSWWRWHSLLGAASTHLIIATNTEMIIFVAMAALGTATTGLAAKDANTHSTAAQVQQATKEVAEGKAPKV